MITGLIFFCSSIALAVLAPAASAGESDHRVYLSPEDFVSQAFSNEAPAAEAIWPRGALKEQLTKILGHKPSLRFKYWGADGKTVWILDEIGKERPITAGVVIQENQIEDIKVLVFRESRGWEVKYDFFTKQFQALQLTPKHALTGQVDNITGATLSVKAMKRMAKAALLLHNHTKSASEAIALAR